jgi:hypothetical protein
MENEEIPKLEWASGCAAEYIMSVGKTVDSMSRDEWFELLHVIVKAYHEAPPF